MAGVFGGSLTLLDQQQQELLEVATLTVTVAEVGIILQWKAVVLLWLPVVLGLLERSERGSITVGPVTFK